jgi:hypothetical protein
MDMDAMGWLTASAMQRAMQRGVFRPIFPYLKTQGFLPLHVEVHAARIRWAKLAK